VSLDPGFCSDYKVSGNQSMRTNFTFHNVSTSSITPRFGRDNYTGLNLAESDYTHVTFWVRSTITGAYRLNMISEIGTTTTERNHNFTINAANTWEQKTIALNSKADLTDVHSIYIRMNGPDIPGRIIDTEYSLWIDAIGFITQ